MQVKSTIRLFKAVPIEKEGKKKISEVILRKCIERGFIFSPKVVYNYPNLDELIRTVEKEVGLTKEKMNSTFHKSWGKVKNASIEQLVFEQIVHYITTYGFEALGIYDESSVYIPAEKLEIPEVGKADIRLVVINGYTKQELKEKLMTILEAGIALKKETIVDVVDVSLFVDLTEKDVEKVRNKEVKIALWDNFGIVPADPIEFLRYAVFKATDKTLLIKSREVFKDIKAKDNLNVVGIFNKYKKDHTLTPLASIFYRFKPLFLAFRTNGQMKGMVNQIRRLAVEYHKPFKQSYLNEVTGIIKNDKIDDKELLKNLKEVNTFRKIRLAYALKYRTKWTDSILYKIRNGRGYATNFNFPEKEEAGRVFEIVKDSIVKDIAKNVKGKKIYIPKNVKYALPATEKQFTGDFPSGSYVSVPKDILFGVSWENVNGHRIDLDLSLINAEGKFGWDARYRNDERSILFSGDMTTGGTEMFYIRRGQLNGTYIFMVNYFNFDPKIDVPYKIIVAQEQVEEMKLNYMVNPNNVVTIAKSSINQKQKLLGLVTTTSEECRFYFAETNIGKSITRSNNEFAEHSRKYLFNFYTDTINLNDILVEAGAKMVDVNQKCDIDLSPEKIEKSKIIDIIAG